MQDIATDKLIGATRRARRPAGDRRRRRHRVRRLRQHPDDGLYRDVTKAAAGTALTIATNAVTDAKLRDSAAVSVIGRAANSSGDPADIAAAGNDTCCGVRPTR